MLEVKDLSFKYTDKMILNNCNLRLFLTDHAVLVGKNGIGKSTLLNLIAKNLIPDSGSVTWLPNIKYAYLDQHLKVSSDILIKDYLYSAFSELLLKEEKMNKLYDSLALADEAQYEKILNQANNINEELERKDFYNHKVLLDNVLAGLGLINLDLNRKLKETSGGQKAKIFLAKLLLDENDCILLDEPTNFLDITYVNWLINYLKKYKKAFLVVTHDEGFARSIANCVFELSNGVINRYNGSYDSYLKERSIRASQYEKDYLAQQKFIKETKDFIAKNIIRATTTKRAQSRRKMLEKLDVLERPKKDIVVHFDFQFSKNLGEDTLVVNELLIGYDKPILDRYISFEIHHNEKIAIMGKNGIGKSTLLKTLMGVIKPIDGSFKFGSFADILYYAQEEAYPDMLPLDYVRSFYPSYDNLKIRSLLARVGILADSMNKSMKNLSGGEQTKVRLAILEEKKCNILILDEPTNHLDTSAKKELYRAINNFPGALILVSHDLEFIEAITDNVINLED